MGSVCRVPVFLLNFPTKVPVVVGEFYLVFTLTWGTGMLNPLFGSNLPPPSFFPNQYNGDITL
jgi:hypothetical protein